ncbi:MAG: TIGR01244 family phosphatase [Rhodobacteraceae bacterium]|nr:TIGR01244 family phosphatase [Paracoccaceae bacterium]
MFIRPITDSYAVTPQIVPADMAEIKAAGYVHIIDNRPDEEVPEELQGDAIETAAKAAGLGFSRIPASHQSLSIAMAKEQSEIVQKAGGPVLAYCASGTRSTLIWALSRLDTLSVDAIVTAAEKAGYDLEPHRPRLVALQADYAAKSKKA